MSSGYDEGPVYYREIQKNAYLKRIPNDISTSKLRPLGHKKPPLKPMWTLFCVHNGRTPFLEQYPEPDSPATLAHRPTWRACLRTARHVTASVKPHVGDEYDFLVDTDHGPVRMLAPDWDSMQDWVTLLRTKLHELRILSRGENVYGAPPAAPLPRAAARDPTSPLPPTPPVPVDRVPGIDLTPITRPSIDQPADAQNTTQTTANPQPEPPTNPPETPTTTQTQYPNTSLNNVTINSLSTDDSNIDISNWEPFSLPSTSRTEPKKSVAKICGQNICLDDSLFKRNVTDSDEEFFAEIDRQDTDFDFKQRVVVNNGEHLDDGDRSPQRSNVTVIQVSNKGPPHTAIPVLGPETDVFDFDFKQSLTITPQEDKNNFINIVNTEAQNDNSYGTVFENGSDYGHLSLTTTVNLTGQDVRMTAGNEPTNIGTVKDGTKVTADDSDVKVTAVKDRTDVRVTAVNGDRDVTVNSDGLYERLCMASTSNVTPSPLSIRRLRASIVRKTSLPNLDTESDYECLFPNSSQTGNTQNGRVNSDVRNNVDTSAVVTRSNVERSQSQNAYDAAPRREARREQNSSPKREVRTEKPELPQQKPIWKRGLTELSLLSRLRGITQIKRQESPTRHEEDGPASPGKVVHRSRPVGRVDSSRRRSNSLTNCQAAQPAALQPLRARQAAALRAGQRRGACAAAVLPARDAPLLCDYERCVWVARWSAVSGARVGGRVGDRLAALGGTPVASALQAKRVLKNLRSPRVDILFHRVPLAKIYVISKMENEGLGIKLDNECCIVSVEPSSAAGRAGIPPKGRWALTEVNNRPIDLLKGGEEDMNRLASHGTEVSILIQPAAFVKKIRAALKANKPLLGLR